MNYRKQLTIARQRGLARSAGLGAAACLIAAAACTPRGEQDASDYHGSVMSQPVAKVDFTLIDTDGQPFHFLAETEGYVTLVFFGYTHCPDVCPIHMANIAAVLKDFPFDLRQQFKVIFVTTDPERDTLEHMREWLDAFDPSFIGLWGTVDEVNAVAAAMWLPPAVRVNAEDGSYEVGHSANVVAFTRDNRAHVRYPFGTRQADWAHDLPKLAAETWEHR
jgi:protein SCO1/2